MSGVLKVPAILLLLLVGTFMLGSGGLIQLKAAIAQKMLDAAWDNTMERHTLTKQSRWQAGEQEDSVFKPWPWADTWPVAKLQIGGVEPMIVLDGATGQALAFGPGRMVESAPGALLIAGHRDTHFRELQELTVGAEISIQTLSGEWRVYYVSDIAVVDSTTHRINIDIDHTGSPDQLMLVTCYPFESFEVGGALRYVVTAKAPV